MIGSTMTSPAATTDERYVCHLNRVRPEDADAVGGKAAGLAALLGAGFPVPPGLCLTGAAFRLALAPYEELIRGALRARDLTVPAVAHEAALAVQEVLTDLTVPKEVLASLREALPNIAGPDAAYLAVRSSSTAEDREDVSFAGQYETVLGVRGIESVREAILTCWRSFFSAHALVARSRAGALGEDEAMPVLVQRLIDAECAGTCFTIDPLADGPDEPPILIDAAWGLGAGAVDGSVSTDTVRVGRVSREVKSEIAEKLERIGLDDAGRLQHQPVPAALRRQACLPEPWARRVAEFGLAAESLFAASQDVEWAIEGGRVWVLQSRPITTLAGASPATVGGHFPVSWEREEDGDLFWRRHDLHRDGDEVLLPQVQESLLLFFRTVWDAAYQNGRKDPTAGGAFASRSAAFNGRIYMAEVPIDLRDGDLRVQFAAGRDLCLRLRDMGCTQWESVSPEIVAATERLAAFDHACGDSARIADHLEDAFGAFRRHWTVHWMPSDDAFLSLVEPYQAAFEAVSGLSGFEAMDASPLLLDGEENLFTVLLDAIHALASTARRDPALRELLLACPEDVMDRLGALPGARGFLEELDAFQSVYGDRCGAGFGSLISILTPTWREEPRIVLQLLRPYLNDGIESPAAARERARRERDALVESYCERCEGPEAEAAIASLRKWLPYTRRVLADLENHNHYIDQMSYGQLRRALLTAAAWLVARGVLTEPHDVFWLFRSEIVGALRSEQPESLHGIVAQRQTEHEEWQKLRPPLVLGRPSADLPPRPPAENGDQGGKAARGADAKPAPEVEEEGVVRGQAASPGQASGRARVIAMGERMPDLRPGDVLVARNAGPMWTPYFPILTAIVLDEGAIVQHATTTAREYGVPAVIRTKHASRRIPDGAWVSVDGSEGVVRVKTDEGLPPAADASA